MYRTVHALGSSKGKGVKMLCPAQSENFKHNYLVSLSHLLYWKIKKAWSCHKYLPRSTFETENGPIEKSKLMMNPLQNNYSWDVNPPSAMIVDWINSFPLCALGARHPERTEESCWPRPFFLTTYFILGMLVPEWKLSSWGIWICNHIDSGEYQYISIWQWEG